MSLPPPPALIIGYGNLHRSDDALGLHAARLLAPRVDPHLVRIIALQQLTFDLAETISKVQLCLLIDAAASATASDTPGEIRIRRILPDRNATNPLHHHLPPESLLAFTLALYHHVPLTLLFTVTAASFDHALGLTPPVAAALPTLVDQLVATLHRELPAAQK